MKWIKTAIGAVIGILSIGIIATSVYKVTQPSEVMREVSFEIDYDEEEYYPISIYNEILEYGVTDEYGDIQNIVLFYVNDEYSFYFTVYTFPDFISFYAETDSDVIDSKITSDGSWIDTDGSLNDDTTVKLVFEVTQPPQLTGISATLILLVPIVFVGGVLLYFYKPFKKD